MNNLFEYGGSAVVLLRLNSETTIDGITYPANSPYTILEDVDISFRYEQIASTIDAKKSVTSGQELRPISINITNLPLTTKVMNLMGKHFAASHSKSVWERYCFNGEQEYYLSKTPLAASVYV